VQYKPILDYDLFELNRKINLSLTCLAPQFDLVLNIRTKNHTAENDNFFFRFEHFNS